ncbi:putative carotenoid isomerooxygenase [Penaeus vannamei]|uniref:Putative carotenoid isomerooxygenase n=1 Tax=Penaeus vannamei TaxID=6689 RepID=A0A3R7LRA5_PENVA|nr:putative carotenoid isomerooxygenase [Penaeus vannamei]
MSSEGAAETRSSSPYRISARHARANAMTTQGHLQTASGDRNTSLDSGCGPAEDTFFIRDLLRESRQVRDENVNCVSEDEFLDRVLEAQIVHRKQLSHVDDFDQDGSAVISKTYLKMDKETGDVTNINGDVKLELKEKITAKFRIATPEELDRNVENCGNKDNYDNQCDNLDTDRNFTENLCGMTENRNRTEEHMNETENGNQMEENGNQTEENGYPAEDRNQAKGDTNSRHVLTTESRPVCDLGTGQGTEGSETNSPVTLRNKRRAAGNSIDSFTATPSDLLKRRSAEIVQLRRKLEAKMKRKSLQNYCLSDDEDAGLLNSDRVDPRTLRRPLSAFGNLYRDSGNEAAFSSHSSCNSSNYPSYCSTPIHRQQYRDKIPPTHAIDPKKLRYLLGDPHYSPPGHSQCISAIPHSESCNSNCGHICHTPSPPESCNCSAVSSPRRSSTCANLQHTCRSPSPYQDAEGFESQYHTPVGSPRPVKSIRPARVTENQDGRINYYPNCDPTIWLRSCEKEIRQPLHGTKSGVIPTWLKGTLIRNGPGRIKVGDQQYNHVFDGSALLHRFHFQKGEVTYQNKFLESRSYLRDTKAQRIVVNYFGTRAHPDPCKTILQNVASKFSFEEHFTDNAQISLYPYGDGLYALTETPFIFRVDPETLDTHEKVNLTHHIAVLTHTAHPHVDRDGTVYNIGQGVGPLGPKYHVCKFPNPKADRKGKVKSPFEQVKVP